MTDYSPRRLTDGIVKSLPLPAKTAMVWDAPDPDRPKLLWVQRFGVRLSRAGTRAFVVEYPVAHGPKRRVNIGDYPTWSTEAARDEALTIKRRAEKDGIDPLEQKQAQRGAMTMEKLCDKFVAEYASTKRAKTEKGYKRNCEKDIKPALGKKLVAAVDEDDVEKLHKAITDRGSPYMANRVVATLSRMFALSMTKKWGKLRSDNPCKGIGRNPEHRRERYITDEELKGLQRALAEYEDQSVANAIRLLLLIGCRKMELLAARWDQFDFERGTWTKLSSETKQKKQHTIPINSTALGILKVVRKAVPPNAVYLFPGDSDGHRGDIKKQWQAIRKSAGIVTTGKLRLRPNDLRHSFASLAADAGASLELVGGLMGHSRIATTQRYVHLFDKSKRQATNKVGSLLSGLVPKRPPAKRKLKVVAGGR